MEQSLKHLTNEELSVALGVVADTESIEEFNEVLAHKLVDAKIIAQETLAKDIGKIISESASDATITSEQMAILSGSEDFANYLAELGISMTNFTSKNYSDQVEILTNFSSKVRDMAS
jgi:metal-dependent amidase/aminoacylase/carboxypeptidase family protein